MNRMGWGLLLVLAITPVWGLRKTTVGELKDELATMHKEGRNDADVADALKQVELSEELTRSMMNSMVADVPGPLSTEQIYVLEARSAMLAPPTTDIPSTAAPDATGQKTILEKATDYVSKIYSQLPALTATRTTLRFQDNIRAAPASSGMHSGAVDISTGARFSNGFQYIRYINSVNAQVASEQGAEKVPSEKDKTPWGANGMIALLDPVPSLTAVFVEAQAGGDIKWLRWELINGKPAAVFSFDVPKKKAHMSVDVCCFPDVEQAGMVRSSTAPINPLGSGGTPEGNFQTNTSYHPYKANVPYHGEFFIDPDSGVVVRMSTQAELKPTEVVHQEDTRIDYGPVDIGGKFLVMPVKTVIDTEVVPYGDSGAAGAYTTRTTFFVSEYKDYK
ncbi:MAG: hypothetical protein WBX19_20740 [Terracidiphilus sp.]